MLFLDLKLINKHSFSLLFQTLFKSCFIMSRRYIFILLGFQCELHNSLVMQWSWYQALNPSNEVVPVRLLYRAISLHKLSRLPRMKILACFRISPLFIFLSGIWRCSIINCKINSHLISFSYENQLNLAPTCHFISMPESMILLYLSLLSYMISSTFFFQFTH